MRLQRAVSQVKSKEIKGWRGVTSEKGQLIRGSSEGVSAPGVVESSDVGGWFLSMTIRPAVQVATSNESASRETSVSLQECSYVPRRVLPGVWRYCESEILIDEVDRIDSSRF